MTAQELIKTALQHREPEKLPIDFGAMRSTGIQAVAYNRLLSHLGMNDEDNRVYDVFQQLAEPSEKVVDRMNGDVMQVHRLCPAFGIDILSWKDGVLPDGSACLYPEGYNPVKNKKNGEDILIGGNVVATRPEGGLYFDTVTHPYIDVSSNSEIDKIPVPEISGHELTFLRGQAQSKRNSTDKALLFAFGGNILEAGQMDFGYEAFYLNLALNPELMHYYFSRLTENYICHLDAIMPEIAGNIDLIQFGDDLGTQLAPQISVPMYRDMIKPYHKKLFRYVRDKWPQVSVFLHSCGAIFDLIPDLIDCGVEVLNPVQVSAAGMDPVSLKKEFGRDLTFWGGGADMQQTVNRGSIQDIKDEVRRFIGIFSRDGGYVFTQVHNIQADVPPEKIMAIYETAAEYR